jgi:hypothetical protein
MLPDGARWSAFAIGRHAFPAVAQTFLMGGNVRIGLEDTIYLDSRVLAKSNAQLVTKARRIVEDLGGRLATPPRRAPAGVCRPRAFADPPPSTPGSTAPHPFSSLMTTSTRGENLSSPSVPSIPRHRTGHRRLRPP